MMMMQRIFVIFWVLILTSSTILAVPFYTQHKRQSDQRIAELETLLAMHKYGVGQPRRVGGRNSAAAGYGLIDFNYIGRRKKSTRSSGGGETLFSSSGGLLDDNGHPPQRFQAKVGGGDGAVTSFHQHEGIKQRFSPPEPASFDQSRQLSPPRFLTLHEKVMLGK